MWTNPATAIGAATLMTLTPVAVRTLGWLLGLRMVLRASRPEERPALLTAFAAAAFALRDGRRIRRDSGSEAFLSGDCACMSPARHKGQDDPSIELHCRPGLTRCPADGPRLDDAARCGGESVA